MRCCETSNVVMTNMMYNDNWQICSLFSETTVFLFLVDKTRAFVHPQETLSYNPPFSSSH